MQRRSVIVAWIGAALVFGWGTVVLVLGGDASEPSATIALMLFLYGALAFGVGLAVMSVVAVVDWVHKGVRPRPILPLAIAAALFAITVYGAMSDAPFTVRFLLSRSAFESAAATVRAGGSVSVPARLGALHASAITTEDGAVRFSVGEVAFSTFTVVNTGTDASPPGSDRVTFQRLAPRWWKETDSW